MEISHSIIFSQLTIKTEMLFDLSIQGMQSA